MLVQLLLFFSFSATTEVVFIFMVGDGIRNVTLRTTKPLNDNEWHYVEAEINVKMARLKVDFYPPAIHKFPGQTFITMQFTQPLLVGANASVRSRLDKVFVFFSISKLLSCCS